MVAPAGWRLPRRPSCPPPWLPAASHAVKAKNDRGCLVAVSPRVGAKRTYPARANPTRHSPRCPQIMRPEGLFGAMNQDPEVVTGHTMIAAYLIFTPLLKEKGLQQAAILFREFVQNLPHLLLHLPPGDGLKDADRRIKNGI